MCVVIQGPWDDMHCDTVVMIQCGLWYRGHDTMCIVILWSWCNMYCDTGVMTQCGLWYRGHDTMPITLYTALNERFTKTIKHSFIYHDWFKQITFTGNNTLFHSEITLLPYCWLRVHRRRSKCLFVTSLPKHCLLINIFKTTSAFVYSHHY